MKVLVKVPASVERGAVFEIKALAMHPMESGQRRDMDGKLVPRRILNRFTCTYNGELVLDCDWHTAIAANPFIAITARAIDSGTIDCAWTDDDGSVERHSAPIKVT